MSIVYTVFVQAFLSYLVIPCLGYADASPAGSPDPGSGDAVLDVAQGG